MDSEEKLAKEMEIYQQMGKTDPNVDVNMLMVNALQTQKQNYVSAKAKRWAYIISIGLPPLGLLWALNYYMKEETDAKTVALMCIAFTIIGIILLYMGAKILL